MYAGIEVGGTKLVCAVGTGPADLGATRAFPTTTPQQTLGAAVSHLAEQQRRHGTITAIGVASFGPVGVDQTRADYGHVTATPKPGWSGVDVVGWLRATFDVPVGFDTDVNGAALGEHRWGAARGLDTFAYVTVGTGIGGGGMAGGSLLHGLLHPEMGHLRVRRHPEDHYAGGCPFHGDCLEGLASGPAIARRWGRPATELGSDTEQAVALEATYLAQLAAAITYLLSAQRIVLGGGVMKLPGLLEAVRRRTGALLGGYPDAPELRSPLTTYLVPPGLGDRAGVLGAIALAEAAEHSA